MIIKEAVFDKSSQTYTDCPTRNIHEYAFIGRSNVGKSSLINMITNRKKLAKTSSTPGKTQLINHFTINDSWYLVDLPGYGYAKVSKKNRSEFSKLIEDYILSRQNLINVFVLIDSRHEPQQLDLEFMRWLGESGIPFSVVFTKIDKLGSSKLNKNITIYQRKMLTIWDELPPFFKTSAESRHGGTDILNYIEKLNNSIRF